MNHKIVEYICRGEKQPPNILFETWITLELTGQGQYVYTVKQLQVDKATLEC